MINECTTSGSTTVASIYGKMPEIPSGYKAIAFRTVKDGDTYLNNLSRVDLATMDFSITGARIILARDTTPRLESLTWTPPAVKVSDIYDDSTLIPDGYELLGFREPEKGEIVLGKLLDPYETNTKWAGRPRLILRRTLQPPAPCTVTVEDVYGKPFEQLTPPMGFEWSTKDGRAEFRLVKEEYYLTTGESHCARMRRGNGYTPRLILTRREEVGRIGKEGRARAQDTSNALR